MVTMAYVGNLLRRHPTILGLKKSWPGIRAAKSRQTRRAVAAGDHRRYAPLPDPDVYLGDYLRRPCGSARRAQRGIC